MDVLVLFQWLTANYSCNKGNGEFPDKLFHDVDHTQSVITSSRVCLEFSTRKSMSQHLQTSQLPREHPLKALPFEVRYLLFIKKLGVYCSLGLAWCYSCWNSPGILSVHSQQLKWMVLIGSWGVEAFSAALTWLQHLVKLVFPLVENPWAKNWGGFKTPWWFLKLKASSKQIKGNESLVRSRR